MYSQCVIVNLSDVTFIYVHEWSIVYSIITSITRIPQSHANLIMSFEIVSSSWPPFSESPVIDWRLPSTPARPPPNPPHPLQPRSAKYTRTAAWDHPPSLPPIRSLRHRRVETLCGLVGWWRPWLSFPMPPAARSVASVCRRGRWG